MAGRDTGPSAANRWMADERAMTGAAALPAAIVVGSHPAQLALRWALAEAAVRSCPVHVVHAWSTGAAGDFVWASRRDLRRTTTAGREPCP